MKKSAAGSHGIMQQSFDHFVYNFEMKTYIRLLIFTDYYLQTLGALLALVTSRVLAPLTCASSPSPAAADVVGTTECLPILIEDVHLVMHLDCCAAVVRQQLQDTADWVAIVVEWRAVLSGLDLPLQIKRSSVQPCQ
jgi:hypothetical protein